MNPLGVFGRPSQRDALEESLQMRIPQQQGPTAAAATPAITPSNPAHLPSHSTNATAGLNLVDDINWPAFAIQQYLEALIVSPLLVVETLTDVQFQKRIDTPGEDHSSYDTYQSVPIGEGDRVMPLHLPRLHADLSKNLREITDSELEGVMGLLKVLQPTIEEFMNDALDVYEDVNPATRIISHAAAGAILSPLELVRTRLTVQAASNSRRKYYGPIHALYSVATDERASPSSGILSTLYAPRVLIPSIIVHAVGPFVRFFSSRLIQKELGLDPSFTPILYRLAVLGFLAVEAAIVTPLEMARKRLQVQRINIKRARSGINSNHAHFNPADVDAQSASGSDSEPSKSVQTFETTVETSSTPYTGMVNCLGSIISEEGGSMPVVETVRKRVPQTASLSAADWQDIYGGGPPPQPSTGIWASTSRLAKGVSTLYRGFWARYAATVVLYVSSEITREEIW